MLAILIFMMIKRNLVPYIIPFISAYLLINPFAISMSLQNSTIWYITCISIIIYLIFKDNIVKNNLHYLLFTIVGMLTSYMDFLTYPIATLGMLLVIVFIAEDLSFKNAIKRILTCGICWTLGYGIMWGAKWILATQIIGKDVLKNALDAAVYRSSNTMLGAEDFLRMDALKSAFNVYDSGILNFIIVINLIICIFIALFNKKEYKIKELLRRVVLALPVLSIGLMPIVWYLVLSNHTMKHPFLSYRTAVVLWFAVLAALFKISTSNNENEKQEVIEKTENK